MANLDNLGALLGDLTTRSEVAPASRNRPINLYTTIIESMTLQEAAVTGSVFTPPFVWNAGSTGLPNMEWGVGYWSTS